MNWFYKLFAPKPTPDPGCCAKCGERRRLNHKINILVFEHKSCSDPTLAAAEAVPEPLRTKLMEGL